MSAVNDNVGVISLSLSPSLPLSLSLRSIRSDL